MNAETFRLSRAELLSVATSPVTWATIGVLLGFMSGYEAAERPVIQAPHECTVMANAADKTFIDYENQVITVHNRATRGMSEFAKHGREMAQLWDAIDEGKSDYRAAKSSCLGGAR